MNRKGISKLVKVQVMAFFAGATLIAGVMRFLFAYPSSTSLFWGGIAGVICMVYAAHRISLLVSKRVEDMKLLASDFVPQKYSETIGTLYGDELEQLDQAIRAMASTLQARIQEVDSEHAKVSAILDNMEEGVLAVNEKREIVLINAAAKKTFDQVDKKVRGKSLLQVTRNEELEKWMIQAANAHKIVAGELDWYGERQVYLNVQAIPIQSDSSDIRGLLVLSDVTELRELEKMRTEFVANVSHELRTPLTSIKGFIETLLGGAYKDAEQTKRFLEMMDHDTTRLTRLISELLELSRIESNKNLLSFERINLFEEVERSVLLCEGLGKKRKISIENSLAQDQEYFVKADRDKVHQVLINLIDNAIKFNVDNGSVKVFAESDGEVTRVTVADTGCGIPEESVNRIFERFYRVDKARSRELGGSGLGLSIVKHIVDAHGGKISCESAEGEGTKISFTLPTVQQMEMKLS